VNDADSLALSVMYIGSTSETSHIHVVHNDNDDDDDDDVTAKFAHLPTQ